MKKLVMLATLFCVSILSSLSYAEEKFPRLTVTLTFVNHSNQTLSYTGVTDTNPENIFLVSPKIVLPGSSVTITSVSNNYNIPDLSGNLQFQDNIGKTHVLHVTDPRQMHYGQTTFFLGNQPSITRLANNEQNVLELSGSTMTDSNVSLAHELIL